MGSFFNECTIIFQGNTHLAISGNIYVVNNLMTYKYLQ